LLSASGHLLNIHQPGIDSHKVLARLRAQPETTDIPVIALSADTMPIDLERGLRADFLRYLAKPVRLREFMISLDLSLK